jgi:fluoroquinolone resistance protein
MEQKLIENKTFEKKDFGKKPLTQGSYELCKFINCNFLEAGLSLINFVDCEFIKCDMSLARFGGTGLRDVKFKDCKMLGLHFENCVEFGLSFSFENCILDHCSFYRRKIRKTNFKDCRLHETDFTECDITNSVFENCDLLRAVFINSILEKSDFRTSYNYTIDPEINKIKKAKFSKDGLAGLLTKYDIKIE